MGLLVERDQVGADVDFSVICSARPISPPWSVAVRPNQTRPVATQRLQNTSSSPMGHEQE